MDNPQLKLVSKEGQIFSISRNAALRSRVIMSMINDDGSEETVPVPEVSSATLELVVEYLNHYQDSTVDPPEIEKPVRSANLAELVPAWDSEFMQKPSEVIFELITAANYLDIKELLDLSAAKIACIMKGKSPEEIRRAFNIVNEFTPEEEAQIREENKWAEEP